MSREKSRRAEKEAHRAEIIRHLVPLYPEGLTFSGLQQALMIARMPMDDSELEFHLAYLEESGYVKRERVSERERGARKWRTVKVAALRKAVDLLDNRLPEADPGIAL